MGLHLVPMQFHKVSTIVLSIVMELLPDFQLNTCLYVENERHMWVWPCAWRGLLKLHRQHSPAVHSLTATPNMFGQGQSNARQTRARISIFGI